MLVNRRAPVIVLDYTTDSAGSQIRQRYEQKDLQRSL